MPQNDLHHTAQLGCEPVCVRNTLVRDFVDAIYHILELNGGEKNFQDLILPQR